MYNNLGIIFCYLCQGGYHFCEIFLKRLCKKNDQLYLYKWHWHSMESDMIHLVFWRRHSYPVCPKPLNNPHFLPHFVFNCSFSPSQTQQKQYNSTGEFPGRKKSLTYSVTLYFYCIEIQHTWLTFCLSITLLKV